VNILGTAQSIITQYPDAIAVLFGTALSWAPGLILETWVLPVTWPDRKMKQVTLAITVAVAFISSTVLWHFLDPADSNSFVGFVSFVAALSAPLVHIVAAKYLTAKFPWIDSVFKKPAP
jgi:hypothetical protein